MSSQTTFVVQQACNDHPDSWADWCGYNNLKDALEHKARFVRASSYIPRLRGIYRYRVIARTERVVR